MTKSVKKQSEGAGEYNICCLVDAIRSNCDWALPVQFHLLLLHLYPKLRIQQDCLPPLIIAYILSFGIFYILYMVCAFEISKSTTIASIKHAFLGLSASNIPSATLPTPTATLLRTSSWPNLLLEKPKHEEALQLCFYSA